MLKYPLVYIIVLNWNGWKDTITCLESLFNLDYKNFRIIVCDNNSNDNSFEKIKGWADGSLELETKSDDDLSSFFDPPIKKPIKYEEIILNCAYDNAYEVKPSICYDFTLIQTGSNLGFAGGNNVGIKHALSHSDCEYIWVLNNDTIVDKQSLKELVKKYLISQDSGICSSTLLYYNKPKVIQALGGAQYFQLFGYIRHIGCGKKYSQDIDTEKIEKIIDYPVGASMLVGRSFLESVGLMCEDYFLYFEELDWAIRCRLNGYRLVYAKESIVYHKEGASTGGNTKESDKKSLISDIYSIKNKIIITKRYFKYAIIPIYLSIVISIFNRIRRKQWERIPIIIKIVLDSFHGM